MYVCTVCSVGAGVPNCGENAPGSGSAALVQLPYLK
jgi:hypothetical protein